MSVYPSGPDTKGIKQGRWQLDQSTGGNSLLPPEGKWTKLTVLGKVFICASERDLV